MKFFYLIIITYFSFFNQAFAVKTFNLKTENPQSNINQPTKNVEKPIKNSPEKEDTNKSTIEEKEIIGNKATIQILNKVTARSSKLEINIGEKTSIDNLVIEVKNCWKAPSYQRPENKILLKIDENTKDEKLKKTIFYGWMFSSSPSLSGLEHPVYDITAINCQ